MKLQNLRITHLPGIRKGFAIEDFAPGINLITGPNASGKSSLVRALRYLIDETAEAPGGSLALEAGLYSDRETWSVTRSGRQIVWQQEGRQVERPPLPCGNFLYCYWLSMDDLLEEGDTEKEILDKLRRALSGGYDLEAVRQQPLFNLGPRYGQNQERDFWQKERHLRKITQDYESLDRQRHELARLKNEIRQASQAQARAAKVKQALEWLDARRNLQAIEKALENFPKGIELLKGGEQARLQELEERREELDKKQNAAGNQLNQARTRMEKTGLAGKPPAAADLEARRQDIEEANQHRTQLEEKQRQLEKARAEENTAAESLQPPPDHIPKLTPENVDQAVQTATELRDQELQLRKLELSAEVEPPPPESLAAHQKLVEELRHWLRQVEPARLRQLFTGGGAALALAVAAALGAWVGGVMTAAGLSLAAAVAGGWILWQLSKMRNQRLEAEQRAGEQELEQPRAWTLKAVKERLQVLETELATLKFQDAEANQAEQARRQIEQVRSELEKLKEKKRELAQAIGFELETSPEGVLRFYQAARNLDHARAERNKLEAEVEKEQREITERIGRVAEYLSRNDSEIEGENAPDLSTVKNHFQALQEKTKVLEAAKNDFTKAEEDLNRLNEEINEVDQSLAKLYQNAGLSSHDRNTLLRLCERYQEYYDLRKEKEKAEIVESQKRSGVEKDSELVKHVEEEDEAALHDLERELSSQAEALDAKHKERAEIEVRLNQAGQDEALAKARLERDRAYNELQDAFEKSMLAEAGQCLLGEIAEEHRTEQEPSMVAAARERFQNYTDNRYSLYLDRHTNLRAYDTEQQIEQGPETLSGGTRMQLLMALRLAWTGSLEKDGEPLPVFLDEALTAADPERFDNIARNLEETAEKEDRQIFYLSAQPADVLRWERAAGRQPHHIHLPRVRFGETGREPADYPVAASEPVLEPGEMNAAEYAARLQVPTVDPNDPVGAIHVFHLLRDDLRLLYRLLNDWRITHLGPLEQLLASDAAAHAVPDGGQRERIQNRCRLTRVWIELWRRGRGRPIDRNTLEASGAVSETFISQVAELAEQVNGDAEKLIEALDNGAVPRFRQQKSQELKEWLEEHGWIDPVEPLSPEERERQLIQRAAEFATPEEIHRVAGYLEGGTQA